MTPRENATIKKKILMDADIVCCTLNSSGSSQLSDSIPSGINSGTTGGMYTSTPVSHFTCVIIDEVFITKIYENIIGKRTMLGILALFCKLKERSLNGWLSAKFINEYIDLAPN